MRHRIPSEHDEQAGVMLWADTMAGQCPELRMLFAVPNGARVQWRTAKRLKAEGLRAGVPDLCLPVARKGWHGLWIEMKRTKGGRLSGEQRWWHQRLAEQGYLCVTAAGAERAIHWLDRYLGLRLAGTTPGGAEDARRWPDAS